jgi:adenylate cyclase
LVVRQQADALITVANEHGLPFWQALGKIFRGWAQVEAGQGRAGRAELQVGLTGYRATAGSLYLPYALVLQSDACRAPGDLPAGLEAIAEAKSAIEATGVRGFEADAHRVEGELRQASGALEAAEACFQSSMAVARSQRARLSELRAAVNLARLWSKGGRRNEAHDLVAPLYAWFTEGLQTADLHAAAALLDQLAHTPA